MAKTKVYYNSACPVCDAGIAYQRRKLQGCDAEVEWVDVHARNEAAGEVGADLELVRERLHVVDAAGAVRVGSEAFRALWGAEVTLVEAADHPLPELLDSEMAACVAGHLVDQGIRLITSSPVDRISADDESVTVYAGEEKIRADAAVVAIGVEARTDLAESAALIRDETERLGRITHSLLTGGALPRLRLNSAAPLLPIVERARALVFAGARARGGSSGIR